MKRLDGEKAWVTATVSDACTSTNGFIPGKTYRGIGKAYGYEVTVERGHRRFISADGDGGAHLQDANDETAGTFYIVPRTEGE